MLVPLTSFVQDNYILSRLVRAPNTAHRWRYANTEPALALGCEWNAESGLGLCGDWLNGGRVENAWHSGRRLAHRVARSFGGS